MQPNNSKSSSSLIYASFDWRAALWASLIAGSVFALLHTGLEWALRGVSPAMPLRMTAAIVLGPDTFSPSDTVDPTIVLVAIGLHVVLSIVYGSLLALVLPAINKLWAVLIGGFYGLALYYINFYGFNAFSPWFADERDWPSIACHLIFGAVLAYAYTTISGRRASLHAGTVDAEASPIGGLGRAE
jgi:hypothetical protein